MVRVTIPDAEGAAPRHSCVGVLRRRLRMTWVNLPVSRECWSLR